MYKPTLAILAALAATTAANASTTISLGGPVSPIHGINWGITHTFWTPYGNIYASGFTASNVPTALFGKNAGGDEIGLGLANDPSGNNEIYYGRGYVQLDVHELFNRVSSITFLTNSTTQGERWTVYGSNMAHSYNTVTDFLVSGSNELGGTLPGIATDRYTYYDFVSTSTSGGRNFLIASVTLTAVPEPATWAMMLFGFGAIGVVTRRRRKEGLAQIA